MFIRIHGLSIEPLEKAKDGIVPVKIVANHLTEDEEDETILRQAFDESTVKKFLDVGIIEWWHKTKNPDLTDEERAGAVLGKPTGFAWENGKPVVFADLTEDHPIVKEMLPHLRAKQPVYAASVGGSKVVMKVNTPSGQKRIVPKIFWDHLALAPSNSVVNQEPGLNIELLQKASGEQDYLLEFDSFKSFKQEQSAQYMNMDFVEMTKALMAPESVSDLQQTSGGVLTKQSLEKTVSSMTFSEDEAMDFIDVILGIKDKKIPANTAGVLDFFEKKNKKGTGDKVVSVINKYFTGVKK